jgi:hypothetical protein
MPGRQRTISVGTSRLFRLVETRHETGDGETMARTTYRVEQAVKDTLTGKWGWRPLATATQWGEAHGAMHQMQADFLDKMIERQGSFRADKVI